MSTLFSRTLCVVTTITIGASAQAGYRYTFTSAGFGGLSLLSPQVVRKNVTFGRDQIVSADPLPSTLASVSFFFIPDAVDPSFPNEVFSLDFNNGSSSYFYFASGTFKTLGEHAAESGPAPAFLAIETTSQPVPEPSSLVAGAALLGPMLLRAGRRRRR